MKALIVGASGLVGSHLMNACKRRGWETIGTYSEHPLPGLVQLQMTDSASTRDVLVKIRPDIVS